MTLGLSCPVHCLGCNETGSRNAIGQDNEILGPILASLGINTDLSKASKERKPLDAELRAAVLGGFIAFDNDKWRTCGAWETTGAALTSSRSDRAAAIPQNLQCRTQQRGVLDQHPEGVVVIRWRFQEHNTFPVVEHLLKPELPLSKASQSQIQRNKLLTIWRLSRSYVNSTKSTSSNASCFVAKRSQTRSEPRNWMG